MNAESGDNDRSKEAPFDKQSNHRSGSRRLLIPAALCFAVTSLLIGFLIFLMPQDLPTVKPVIIVKEPDSGHDEPIGAGTNPGGSPMEPDDGSNKNATGSPGTDLSSVGANGFERVFTSGLGASVDTIRPIVLEESILLTRRRHTRFTRVSLDVTSKHFFNRSGPVTAGPMAFEGEPVPVPSLRGLSVAEAKQKIEKLDFKFKAVSSSEPEDIVISAVPGKGLAAHESTITIDLVGVRVPEIVNLSLGDADALVEAARLTPDRDVSVRPHHPVTHMRPRAGSVVPARSPVRFSSMTRVPNFFGKSTSYVLSTLEEEDLGVIPIARPRLDDDVVCAQAPRGGAQLERGKGVKIEMGAIMPNLIGLQISGVDVRLRSKLIDGRITSRKWRVIRTSTIYASNQESKESRSVAFSNPQHEPISRTMDAGIEEHSFAIPNQTLAGIYNPESQDGNGGQDQPEAQNPDFVPQQGGSQGGMSGGVQPLPPPRQPLVTYQLIGSIVTGQTARAGFPVSRRRPVGIELTFEYLKTITIQQAPTDPGNEFGGAGGGGMGGGGMF